MEPDWPKFVEEFCKPVSMLTITILAMFFITMGLHAIIYAVKTEKKLKKKFGDKTANWILEEE